MTLHEETFGKDYFENGVSTRVSGYTNYHWRPEYVLPLANWIKMKFGEDRTYLDYGCAKGFLVKALHMLNCEAYGYDVSEYAIANCEPEVKEYCTSDPIKFPQHCDVFIMKDVLEHIPEDELFLHLEIAREAGYVIAIIPLGDNNQFRIREYELDVTHVTKKDEVWWVNKFNEAGLVLDEFYYSIDGIKDNWTKNFPYGNGIFIFKRKSE